MQQDLKISFTKAFLVKDQFCQLDQTHSQYVVRNIRLKYLSDVVQYRLCIQIIVDVLTLGLILIPANKNSFKYD